MSAHMEAMMSTAVSVTPSMRGPQFSSHPLRPRLRYGPEESLLRSASGCRRRAAGERPKVLLLVPPYTRMVEPVPPGSPYAEIGLDSFEVMKRAGTPIGLLRIGTSANRAGFDVRIVDAPFAGWSQESEYLTVPEGNMLRYGLTDDQLVAIINGYEPDIVGIQCNYTVQWGNARALADLVKSVDPSLVVVTGGAHSSGDWENVLLDSPFDIDVINEADRSFVQLLEALTTPGGNVATVRGVAFRQSGRLVNTNLTISGGHRSVYIPLNHKVQDLNTRKRLLPLPDFSLIDMEWYQQPYHSAGARVRNHGAWAQVFSTIGCNINCNFCYIPKINGPWRALGLDWFDEHLADLIRHGVTEVLIEDDHLLHDPLYAMGVFRLLKKYQLPWVEEGGLSLFNLVLMHTGRSLIDALDPEEVHTPAFRNVIKAVDAGIDARTFIQAMADSGCYSVYLAVESANSESLENSNKPRFNALQQTTAEIVQIFAETGIQVTGGFMLGFVNPPKQPGGRPFVESIEQIEHTIEYAARLMGRGMAYANPFIVTPIPGTPMWNHQRHYVVRNYDLGWSHEKATMATQAWSAEKLEEMRLRLMVRANGEDRVRKMVARGTWPVGA
jgi:anaerobic magnesium-protoporphyrin IX monomethyl ester cyclase